MPKSIWNEGRVRGMDAFESYLKKALENDPNTPPATETEWLSSSVGLGASMLVKIKPSAVSKSGPQSIDIPFPAGCRLCAANNIIANLFHGKGYYGGNETNGSKACWATKIQEYSPLIENDAAKSPEGVVNGAAPADGIADTSGEGAWPHKDDAHYDDAKRKQLVDYMKILEGVILQPGTWSANPNVPPQKEFTPDLAKPPVLRMLFVDKLEGEIELLLTGFTDRVVIKGETGVDTSVNTLSPDSGDFLGPATFPWAVKIEFTVPTSALSYFMLEKYKRKIQRDAQEIKVDDTAVIDMRTTDPATYYAIAEHNAARVEMTVTDFTTTGVGDSVLTTYQKPSISKGSNDEKYKYPPALWGTYVTVKGDNYLHPLDVVAPGTVKMFPSTGDPNEDQAQMKDYQDTFPETWGLTHNPDGTLSGLDDDDKIQKIGDIQHEDIVYTNPSGGPNVAQQYVVQTGKRYGRFIALSAEVGVDKKPDQYKISPDPAKDTVIGNTHFDVGNQTKIAPPSSNVNWSMILEALANNKSIDILGDNMKALKAGLNAGAYPYIQFSNNLRLYISNSEPPTAGVPIGSIGIGWGMST